MVPPATNLARDAILQSMLDHVLEYDKKYPLVQIDVLKDLVIKEVIDAPKNKSRFDPNVQLRGFLKTFEDTPAFKSQFDILDDATKGQIRAFKDEKNNGADWKETISNGFRFPDINPKVGKILNRMGTRYKCSVFPYDYRTVQPAITVCQYPRCLLTGFR